MAFSLPNPTVPTNGQSLDATPLLANIVALAQAIASFDGSQIQAGSILPASFNANINPNTLLKETTVPFVASGLVWSTISGLAAGMTSGVLYYNGIREPVNSVSSETFTASKDTYIDIDVNGNVTYNAVSNNASAPSLTTNSIRVAKVVTGSSSIGSITQIGSDSLGNLIYPVGATSALAIQNPYKFTVSRTNALNTANNASAILAFDTKIYDSGNNVDITTNKGRFTAPVAGFYQFSSSVGITSGGTLTVIISLFKNGSEILRGNQFSVGASTPHIGVTSPPIQLAATDYVEVSVFSSATSAFVVNSAETYFGGGLVSRT